MKKNDEIETTDGERERLEQIAANKQLAEKGGREASKLPTKSKLLDSTDRR